MSGSRRQSAWDEVILELGEIRSSGDQSSLLDSPRSQTSVSLKKLKPNNRIGSPQFHDSTSSASLSPATQNAFFAKSKITLKPISLSENSSEPNRPSSEDTKSSKSYRAQLRQRFLSIKQQAQYTANKAKIQIEKRKKQETVVSGLQQQDEVLTAQLTNREEIFDKKFSKKQKAKILAIDFFCKTDGFEVEEIESEKEVGDVIEEEKQTVLDLLNLVEDDLLIEFRKPENRNVEEFGKEIVYFGGSKVSLGKELGEEFEPRSLEDEGLFVGIKPRIQGRILKILEEQLMSTQLKRDWFGVDGELSLLPDPRREAALKPIILTDIFTYFKSPLIYIPGLMPIISKEQTIKLYLGKIHFKHHPLFSPEHFLVQRLKALLREFAETQKQDSLGKLEQKLSMLRQAKRKIEETMESNEEVSEKKLQRLTNYRDTIKKLRLERLEVSKQNRDLIKSIIGVWKNLKLVREKQKYLSTNLRLIITKQKCSYIEEKEKWDQLIEMETNEIYAEKSSEYKNMIEEYRKDLKEWRQHTEDFEKPRKPQQNFTEDSIREEILDQFLKHLKPPGEPILHFRVEQDLEITTELTYPRELARRNSVNRTKITIKVFNDDKELLKTKYVDLTDSFVLKFDETVMIDTKEGLRIEITEQTSMGKVVYGTELTNVDFGSKKQRLEFESNQIFTYSHTGIGAGPNLDSIFNTYSLDIDSKDAYLSGYLSFRLGWEVDVSESPRIEPNQLDPQNPLNSQILEVIQEEQSDYFRLDVGVDFFCTDEEIDNNLRFRMLILRNEGEPEFQNQVIPNREKDIDPEILANFERNKLESKFIDDIDESHIDGRRQWGLKQYYEIRQKVQDACKTADSSYTLKDVLVDDEVPDLSLLFATIMEWFQPKRRLRPRRKTLASTGPSVNLASQIDFKIVINIVQAFQVPTRKMAMQDTTISPSRKSVSDIFTLIPVRPCVTAAYGKQIISTTTAEGSNPTWNQELILTIPHKNRQHTSGNIHINLFDEQILDLLDDDRFRDSDIYQRRQLHFLGSIQLSLDTLKQTNRVEGTFEMNTPLLILGYDKQSQTKEQVIDISPRSTTDGRDSTYLNLFVTLIPSLNSNNNSSDKLECNEAKSLINFIQEWENDYREKFPSRIFPILVKDSTCKTSCITRLLKPLNSPDFQHDYTENACSRFVSMIPLVDSDPDLNGIWLTADQMLKMQLGSIADHAILLQCLLMGLEANSWLGLGHSIHYGRSAFVLIKDEIGKDDFKISIFNPSNGNKYDVRDTFNPIKRIFCLINHENVWANIQKEDRLDLIRYDTSKSTDWLPLFDKETPAPVGSLQPNTLDYTTDFNPRNLEEIIENKLKIKIMKWRKHKSTTWNRHASAVYKKLLPILELHKVSGKNGNVDYTEHQDLSLDVQNLMNTHKVYGFSLNTEYNSVKSVTDMVRRTNIHAIDAPNIEFAVAVHVHHYAGGICVVWVFIANLMRRR